MAKISQISGRSRNIATGITQYVSLNTGAVITNNGAEAGSNRTVRSAGVYSNMYIRVISNDLTGTTTVRFRKNTANGSQSFTVGAGLTGEYTDASGTDSVAVTDTCCISVACGGGGSLFTYTQIGCAFAATTGTVSVVSSGQVGVYNANAIKHYIRHSSVQATSATESADIRLKAKIAFDIKNYACSIIGNARTTATLIGPRIAGADGTNQISVGVGATGWLEDTTHTDAVVSGNLLNKYILGGASAENFNVQQLHEEHSASEQVQYSAQSQNSIGASTTRYDNIDGYSSMFTTQSDAQRPMQFFARISAGQIYITSNGTSANSTLTLQKNGSDTSFVVTVGAGVTGIVEYTATTVDFSPSDLINWKWVTGAGGTVVSDWTSLVATVYTPATFYSKSVVVTAQQEFEPDLFTTSPTTAFGRAPVIPGGGTGGTPKDDLYFFRNRRRLR